jgi:Na+-transporting methylmalonyl-CoA/oxaloacetate decarboxylase gamma subunit
MSAHVIPTMANLFSLESVTLALLFSYMSQSRVITKVGELSGLRGIPLALVAGLVFVFIFLIIMNVVVSRVGTSNAIAFLGQTSTKERVQWASGPSATTAGTVVVGAGMF